MKTINQAAKFATWPILFDRRQIAVCRQKDIQDDNPFYHGPGWGQQKLYFVF
jgi:hypothetical protein